MEEDLSKLSDKELAQLHGGIGNPDYRELVLAEERRRSMGHAKRANYIAVAALLVATHPSEYDFFRFLRRPLRRVIT